IAELAPVVLARGKYGALRAQYQRKRPHRGDAQPVPIDAPAYFGHGHVGDGGRVDTQFAVGILAPGVEIAIGSQAHRVVVAGRDLHQRHAGRDGPLADGPG
nr:hypothetical protein [Tanacetum cinerariifolium]